MMTANAVNGLSIGSWSINIAWKKSPGLNVVPLSTFSAGGNGVSVGVGMLRGVTVGVSVGLGV
jgi:hypothetical protein